MVRSTTIAVGALAGLAGVALLVAVYGAGGSESDNKSVVKLSALDKAVTPTEFKLDVGTNPYKITLDGVYKGEFNTNIYDVSVPQGAHKIRVSPSKGDQVRADFTAVSVVKSPVTATPTPSPAAVPSVSPTPIKSPVETPTATPTATGANYVRAGSVEQVRTAVAAARPGTVIEVADGIYTFVKPQLELTVNGSKSSPITLRGSRNVIFRTRDIKDNYGIHITGDYWKIEGITVAYATKGVVLDESIGTVLNGISVHDIGDEGVHFRDCSSYGVLRNSVVQDTGLGSPQYGEGVYVGSANSNWSKYNCEDGKDNSENVLIENNTFKHISAEGADLKEGTESGILRNNIFDNAGYSGQNSADSAVDAKGNNWIIEDNVVRNPIGAFLDAFQTHNVSKGYGTGNVFRGNVVEGTISGWGFGLYPATGNVVYCDNKAPGAKALVGDGKSNEAKCVK